MQKTKKNIYVGGSSSEKVFRFSVDFFQSRYPLEDSPTNKTEGNKTPNRD
jgi:hypothetical protein